MKKKSTKLASLQNLKECGWPGGGGPHPPTGPQGRGRMGVPTGQDPNSFRFWKGCSGGIAILGAVLLWFPTNAHSQASETAIIQQAVQLQAEAPTDTRIADYYAQLKTSPKDPQIHLKLGEVYSERGLYELAIVSFRQALAFQEKFAAAHVGLSKVFRKQKENAWELAEMVAAVADEPDNAELRLRLGTLYMEPQHYDFNKAKKEFKALKKLESPLALELGTKMGLD